MATLSKAINGIRLVRKQPNTSLYLDPQFKIDHCKCEMLQKMKNKNEARINGSPVEITWQQQKVNAWPIGIKWQQQGVRALSNHKYYINKTVATKPEQ